MSQEHFFELRVRFSDVAGLSCQLFEMPPKNGSGKRRQAHKLSEVDEGYLKYVDGAVHRTLKNSGYKPSQLSPRRKSPFKLEEEEGIRLNLVFKAVVGLKKRSRIEDIILGVSAMAREEAYYWHGLLLRDDKQAEKRGLKALRVVLGGE